MRSRRAGSALALLLAAATASADANRGPSPRPALPPVPSWAPVAVPAGSSDDLKACAAEWSRALGLGGIVSELPADPG